MEKQKYIPALGYDFLSDYYDLAIKLTMPESKFREKLVDWVDPQPGEHILEFGFGTAANLVLLKQKQGQVILEGVDIDPKILAIAEHKLAKHQIELPLHLYDGKILPFADSSFDKVYSSLVFHQLDAPTKTIALIELHRVLKPNGKLIIADWGKAKNRHMRTAFYLVQLLDGFNTTNDNVKGLMPDFIRKAGFPVATEVDFINTMIGTFSYYKVTKEA